MDNSLVAFYNSFQLMFFLLNFCFVLFHVFFLKLFTYLLFAHSIFTIPVSSTLEIVLVNNKDWKHSSTCRDAYVCSYIVYAFWLRYFVYMKLHVCFLGFSAKTFSLFCDFPKPVLSTLKI